LDFLVLLETLLALSPVVPWAEPDFDFELENPDLNPGVFTVLPDDIYFLSGEDFCENFSIELAL
jgi:hypothetical protein